MILLASFILSCSCFCWKCGAMADAITTSRFITYGEVIASNASRFQMGFFSPANSTNHYLGIWYYGTKAVEGIIWVARIWKNEGAGLVPQTLVVAPRNECAVYGRCGPFGSCDPENQTSAAV